MNEGIGIVPILMLVVIAFLIFNYYPAVVAPQPQPTPEPQPAPTPQPTPAPVPAPLPLPVPPPNDAPPATPPPSTQPPPIIDLRTNWEQQIDASGYSGHNEARVNKCLPYVYDGDLYANSVNIVVFGYGYPTMQAFDNSMYTVLFNSSTAFFNTEPFKTRRADINIWTYPAQLKSIDMSTIGALPQSLAFPEVRDAMANCTVDYMMILDNSGKYTAHLGYTPNGKGQMFATAYLRTSSGYLMSHELGGHGIGTLADQYFTPTKTAAATLTTFKGATQSILAWNNEIQCDNNSICSRFNDIQNQCVPGCSGFKDLYRASTESIMGVPSGMTPTANAYSFNEVEKFIIDRRISSIIAHSKSNSIGARYPSSIPVSPLPRTCLDFGCSSTSLICKLTTSADYQCVPKTCLDKGCQAGQVCKQVAGAYQCVTRTCADTTCPPGKVCRETDGTAHCVTA